MKNLTHGYQTDFPVSAETEKTPDNWTMGQILITTAVAIGEIGLPVNSIRTFSSSFPGSGDFNLLLKFSRNLDLGC
jgi:hypothetical protein